MPDLELDPRWPRLLAAARVWRASRIPGTSTTSLRPADQLAAAIDAFDQGAPEGVVGCTHVRRDLVFYVDGRIECSRCGRIIVPSS